MTERLPIKIRPEDYVLDSRDDRTTEIRIDRDAEYLIVETNPHEIYANLIDNLPLPRKTIKRLRKALNRLDAEIELKVREQMELDMRDAAISDLIASIQDNGFSLREFKEILEDQIR